MSTETEKRVQGEVRTSDARRVMDTARRLVDEPDIYEHVEALRQDIQRAEENSGYNGWSNYETWAMALWIDNSLDTYEESRELARTALQEHEDRTGYGATAEGSLAHALKEWMEEQRPEEVTAASVWTDLLSAAFGDIDWFEIAANYIEEVQNES